MRIQSFPLLFTSFSGVPLLTWILDIGFFVCFVFKAPLTDYNVQPQLETHGSVLLCSLCRWDNRGPEKFRMIPGQT